MGDHTRTAETIVVGCTVAVLLAAGCARTRPSPADLHTSSTESVTSIVPAAADARLPRVEDLLQGMPGVYLAPVAGGLYRIRIRGQHSVRGISTDDDPLLVVDGVPMSGAAQARTLAGLSPADVAQIDVLKDTAATSRFGSRGANGVIVITTKRAR
ncbi:MAG: hypothetical protein NVS1B4_14430 [Gemmatimonadaceae bacterium]